MTDIEQKLKAEIEAHRNTTFELHALKYKYAHLEMMTEGEPTREYIQNLLSERMKFKIKISELKERVKQLESLILLPGKVSVSGIARKYDHTNRKRY